MATVRATMIGVQFAIGPFLLDSEQRILSREGAIVPLTPKAVELLIVLAKRLGEVVSKEDLLKGVWPDTWVDESTLAKLVFTLRRELGPLPDGRPFIETISKRGYRLLSEVASVGAEPQQGTPAPIKESTRRNVPAILRRRVLFGLTALLALIAIGIVAGIRLKSEEGSSAAKTESSKDPPAEFITARLTSMPGLDVKAPVLIHRELPRYTQDARKAGLEGIVVLGLVIDRQGNVSEAHVLKGLPLGLDQEALNAARKWRFKPATLNGQPVPVQSDITINFRLNP